MPQDKQLQLEILAGLRAAVERERIALVQKSITPKKLDKQRKNELISIEEKAGKSTRIEEIDMDYKCLECSNDKFFLTTPMEEEEFTMDGEVLKRLKPFVQFNVRCSKCDHTLNFKRESKND